MLKRLNTTKFVCALIFSVLVVGCAAKKQQENIDASASLVAAEHPAKIYLAQATSSSLPEKRDRYLLLAAHAYINDGNFNSAVNVLTSMQKSMVNVASLQAEHIYLRARIAEKTNSSQAALDILQYPPHWQLPRWQMASYHQFKAKLYKNTQQPIDQVKQLSLLSNYLPKSETTAVNNVIWKLLQPLHEETVQSFMRDQSNPIFAGWLQLTFIAKHYAVEPTQLVRYLGEWQRNNPNHPAAMKLPADLEKALNAKPFRPQNIAVLLPLTGPRAVVAEPIRQGLLSSYLSDYDANVSINFYDTQQGVAIAYQQAVTKGAEFIIGPLLPNEVEELQKINDKQKSTVPQLYLNQTDTFVPQPNLFYFSLSPAQEASDAAHKLYSDGVKQPLLLASNDPIGKRMADSFKQTWLTLTSNDAEVYFYDAGDQMKVTVQEALGVKDSQARISRMRDLLGSRLASDFRSRQDIDAIYMISGSQDLALLKPFLDVNFSVFSEPVTLYTTSRSRLENESAQSSQELNNLMISDVPWLMQSSSETQLVSELWSGWNNTQKRLYVMGFDALELVNRLAQMRAFPGYQFMGRSGALSVKPNGVIDRQLSWGKYTQGKLTPL
ncbi:penicillin-binding protein activator [Shewanella livingstonensis]|uniref:Penicillin-binding protein activator n=1 Tax=Shewanella livingstonensis TaxID=150120 RepID=A0A3G8LSP6_9GAMM|nr:penicillin-binding protein activator [Shewanella livingstonensis]AZG71892.1 penicillin-binding protein activator [Shewanella livingstonensis]